MRAGHTAIGRGRTIYAGLGVVIAVVDIVIGAFIVGNLAVIAVHIPDLNGVGTGDVVQIDLAGLGHAGSIVSRVRALDDGLVHGAHAAIAVILGLAGVQRNGVGGQSNAGVIGVGVLPAELQVRVGHDDVVIVLATLGQAVILGRSAMIFDILRPAVARCHTIAIVVNNGVRAAHGIVVAGDLGCRYRGRMDVGPSVVQ